jgi:hypothetical protein
MTESQNISPERNVDPSELARFGALAPRWWSSAAKAARGSGMDAGRWARQGWWAAPEAK